MKVLITGANGFIGKQLTSSFERKGFNVLQLCKYDGHSIDLKNHNYVDIRLPDTRVYEIIRDFKPDILIHAAGTASVPYSVEEPYKDFDVSVPGTAMLLDAIRMHSSKTHFMFLSSAAVYGNPKVLPIHEKAPLKALSPYGFHKRMGELLCEEYAILYGIKSTVLRIFSAFGPGLKRQVIYDITVKLLEAKKMKTAIELWGTGDESRDFIFIEDVIQAISVIADKAQKKFEVYNVASGTETTIKTLVQHLVKELDYKGEVFFNGKIRKGDPLNWCANIERLRNLGFSSTIKLSSALSKTIAWINLNE